IILLNKASTCQHSGKHEEALEVLEKAAHAIEGDRRPRLRCVLLYNQASSLCALDRAEEAEPIVREVRHLAEHLRNEIDLIKTLWLEGKCAAGMGRKAEALANLEQVRRDFEDLDLPFDYALATLDAVLLYREEGRFSEIKALAVKILEIFKAQKVHREAITSITLFQEAAESERVTLDLILRLQDYLSKARSNLTLHF